MKLFNKDDAPGVAAWLMKKSESGRANFSMFRDETGELSLDVAPLGLVSGSEATARVLALLTEGIWDEKQLG